MSVFCPRFSSNSLNPEHKQLNTNKIMEPELQRRVQRYGWDKAAEFYETSWKEQLKPAQDLLIKTADLKKGENVLETACGTGLITFRIAESVKPGGSVTATDLSGSMIEIAGEESDRRSVSNVSFQRMDAEKLSLQDQKFDAALCSLGIMYYPDPVQSLREMHRILKPGGRAAVVTWGERKKCGWAEIFPIVDKRVATDVCPLFFQQGTGNTLELSFQKAGFSDIKTKRMSVKLHYSSADIALMAAFAGGPVALAYQKFDDQTKENAHREYLESIKPYQNGSGYDIPGEFVAVIGKKV